MSAGCCLQNRSRFRGSQRFRGSEDSRIIGALGGFLFMPLVAISALQRLVACCATGDITIAGEEREGEKEAGREGEKGGGEAGREGGREGYLAPTYLPTYLPTYMHT